MNLQYNKAPECIESSKANDTLRKQKDRGGISASGELVDSKRGVCRCRAHTSVATPKPHTLVATPNPAALLGKRRRRRWSLLLEPAAAAAAAAVYCCCCLLLLLQ
eukprot:COSAG02_NODE_1493_length_12330_cov_3.681710_8_plen_105_part_00